MGKVLVVDDSIDFLEAIKASMEASGFSVETAQGGFEALAKIKGGSFAVDCVLTDYNMPEMRGDELAQAIKHSTDIPVIIMTGESGIQADRLFKAGISGIINKPFDAEDFIEFLKNNDLHIEQESTKQRKFLRQRSAEKSHKITLSNGRQSVIGEILNVSSGGIGVILEQYLQPISTVEFTLDINGGRIKGYMHCRWESRTTDRFNVGFEFDSLTKKALSSNPVFCKWITIPKASA